MIAVAVVVKLRYCCGSGYHWRNKRKWKTICTEVVADRPGRIALVVEFESRSVALALSVVSVCIKERSLPRWLTILTI